MGCGGSTPDSVAPTEDKLRVYDGVLLDDEEHVKGVASLAEADCTTVEKRAASVGKCLGNLFKEDRVMKNLLCQVGSMLHSSLTRNCNAEQHEALAMFKTRVLIQYWKSGLDEELGANIPPRFLECLDKIFKLVQIKAVRQGQLSPDQHGLLLQVGIYFHDELDHVEDQREYSETLGFLSALFELLQQLLAYMGKQKAMRRSVGFSKLCQQFSDSEIKELMNSVGCVHHAMKMARLTGSDHVGRPAFIGMESIGKSSLINYLVEGSNSDLLPTGTNRQTEGVALVQNGETACVMFDDDSTEASMREGVTSSMQAVARQLKEDKVYDKVSLDTPMQRVITPFRHGAGRIEYLDVPGIRADTELDVALSLGCCSLIVLCTNSPTMFEAACQPGGDLVSFVKMYANLGKPPKIILAITRPMEADKKLFKYDKETFEITEPVNFVEEFGKKLKVFFPSCPDHRVMFADTVSMGAHSQLGQAFINRFLSVVSSFGDSSAMDPSEQLVLLKDRVVRFAASMEDALVKNSEFDKFSSMFEAARHSAESSLESFRYIATAQREWNIGLPLTNPMKDYVERVKHLDRFTAVGFTGEGVVFGVDKGKLRLQNDILQQSRCELMKSVKVNGENAFKQVWQCMEAFVTLYLNGETAERFAHAQLAPEGHFDDVLRMHLYDKAAEFADCVAAASNTKEARVWPTPIQDGETDPLVLAKDYRKWFQKSACELRGFAGSKRFSWYLNGYYASVADAHQKAAFLGSEASPILRLNTGKYVSQDMVGSSAIGRFPDCTDQLAGFGTKVNQWISKIQEIKSDPEHSGARDRQIMVCALEAAAEVVVVLEGSNVIQGDNPLVVKLVDLAFAMIERLMVLYDKDEQDDRNRYQWTEFAQWMQKETQKGGSLELARFCNSKLLKSVDLHKMQRPEEVLELVDAMSSAKTILEADAGSGGKKAHGTLASITEDLSEDLSNLQAVKLSVVQSMKKSVEFKVFVGSVAHRTDVSQIVQVVRQQFPKLQPVQCIGNWEDLCQSLEREQPPIAFLVRGPEIMSSDPQDGEVKFLNKMRYAPFLGVIIICSEMDVSTANWNKECGIECRHLKCSFGSGQETVTASAEDMLGKCGDDLFFSVQGNLKARSDQAKNRLIKMKGSTQDALARFMQLKGEAQRVGPSQFYHNLIKHRKVRTTSVDFKEKLKIHLPSVQTFYQDPFLEQICEDGKQIVQELQIRHFLQAVISSQLMGFGRKLAESLYAGVIGKMIAVLISDQFGTKPEKFATLLERYVKSEGSNSEEAGSGARSEMHRRRDDHTPAEFLLKSNFISMYVGGTVLATCPMLYAMLGAPLMETGTSVGEPTRRHHDDHLLTATEHYKHLRDVGNLMEESSDKNSVSTSSTRAS